MDGAIRLTRHLLDEVMPTVRRDAMMESQARAEQRAPGRSVHRALFLSDLHLGTRGCQARLILDFLRHNEAATIYLVGDIVDGWRLKRRWYWPQAHTEVVGALLRCARRGARVVFLPGNHDEFARSWIGHSLGGIEVTDRVIHTTVDGRRFLVMHGDQFDVVIRHVRWLAHVGDRAYEAALLITWLCHRARYAFGLPYWSFSGWAKQKVKTAVNFIGDFEERVAGEARGAGVDGVVCGHIHHAAVRQMDGVTYVNIGDFVESCTAVVERADGRLEIIPWRTETSARFGFSEATATAPA